MQILFDGFYANNLQIISAEPVQSVFLWRRLSKTLKNYQNLTTESGSKLRFSLLKEKVVIQVMMMPICKISFRFLKKWRQESKMYSNGKSVSSPLPLDFWFTLIPTILILIVRIWLELLKVIIYQTIKEFHLKLGFKFLNGIKMRRNFFILHH